MSLQPQFNARVYLLKRKSHLLTKLLRDNQKPDMFLARKINTHLICIKDVLSRLT